jgi:hypothetical protein
MSESGYTHVVISQGSSAVVVSGVTGKKIRVINCILDVNNGSDTFKWQSKNGATFTDITGNLWLSSGPDPGSTATGALVLPDSEVGWFETNAGEDLYLLFNGGGNGAGCGGSLTYELI